VGVVKMNHDKGHGLCFVIPLTVWWGFLCRVIGFMPALGSPHADVAHYTGMGG